MLAPWKKSYDKSRQYIKSRDITLPTKVCLVKPMVFPVVMYGCECWTIKKAEHQRIDAFQLWCWRRLWELQEIKPVNPRKSTVTIHWKDWCWSWSSNTLATWCEKPTSFEKTLMLGKIEGRRRRAQQRTRWLDGITQLIPQSYHTQWTWVWASSGRRWRTGKPGMLQSTESQRVRHDWATEQQLKYFTAIGVNYSNSFLKDNFCFSLQWL